MTLARSATELINICKENNISLSEYAIAREMEDKGLSRKALFEQMKKTLDVMREGATLGREKAVYSLSGLIGGDTYKLQQYLNTGKSLMDSAIIKAMAMALSSSEVNGSMGKIVACPTAGSCGILPAVILTAGEELGKTDEEMIQGLFAAAAVGMLIGMNATFAGAEGGCQAECGSAAAMASAAVVEMMWGTPEMSLDAGAIVFKNVLGLVCDPVAGLVEIPCAKRNASGAISALSTAPLSSMALTAILGLTGTPMAIEPLTQADLISANPLPVYMTNFIGGAMSGIIVALMGLTNMMPGTATPIAGFAVMFAYNPAGKVLIAATGCIVVSVIACFIGYFLFKNTKIKTAAEIRGESA